MTGKDLGEEYLRQDKVAWSARSESIILAAFDRLEKIRDQARAMSAEDIAAFDAVTVPQGFKPLSKMIG